MTCFAVSVSEKSNLILNILFALFSTLTATEALLYPRSVVVLTSANHTQPLCGRQGGRSRLLAQLLAAGAPGGRGVGENGAEFGGLLVDRLRAVAGE